MARSIIDAIKEGNWDFEPELEPTEPIDKTNALPGSTEKLSVLADRLRQGLPLWQPSDRRSFSDAEDGH